MTVFVDGNNVIGATADGWWRDRPAAARRLLARLACHQGRQGGELVLVLDVAQPDLPEGEHDGVTVRYARRGGRNAADERIVELLRERGGDGAEVVTSDRELAAASRRAGATVTGARTFLDRIARDGC